MDAQATRVAGDVDRKDHAATRTSFTAWSFPRFALQRVALLAACLAVVAAATFDVDGFRTTPADEHRNVHDCFYRKEKNRCLAGLIRGEIIFASPVAANLAVAEPRAEDGGLCVLSHRSEMPRALVCRTAAPTADDFDGAMNAMFRPNTPELSTLLPREVATVVVAPRHRDVPVLAAEAEYLALHRMHPRREAEFRAGRACAREALARIGIDGWPLIPASTREPQWPADVVGSITHSGGYCAAAVARGHQCAGIGIDVEATGRVGNELAAAVCSRDELAALDKRDPGDRAGLLTLIFSAKESVFKAIFPRQRLFVEFDDVEIEFEPENATFRALGRAPELERLLARLEGRFAIGKVNLATTAVLTH